MEDRELIIVSNFVEYILEGCEDTFLLYEEGDGEGFLTKEDYAKMLSVYSSILLSKEFKDISKLIIKHINRGKLNLINEKLDDF